MNNIAKPEDAIRIDDRIYFFTSDFNGLFYADVNEDTAKFICCIEEEKLEGQRLYSSIQCVQKRYICLIPFFAKQIVLYDLKKEKYILIDLPKEIKNEEMKFMASIVYKDKIYMFGLFVSRIYVLDVEKGICEMACDWEDLITSGLIFDSKDAFFRQQVLLYEDCIIVPFCNANAVLMFYPDDNRCNITKMGLEKNGYSGIAMYDNQIFLSPRNAEYMALKWNCSTDEKQYIPIDPDVYIGVDIINGEPNFLNAKSYGFIRCDEGLVYEIKKNQISEIIGLSNKIWKTEFDPKTVAVNRKMIKQGDIIKEREWFMLDRFLECI